MKKGSYLRFTNASTLSMANCYFAKPHGMQHLLHSFSMLLISNPLLTLAKHRLWAEFSDMVFRSPLFPFLGRRTEAYGLSDRQSTDASDRAVDSRVVLVRTNDRLQHFWRRTC
jgi:hypothetical protein